MLKKNLTDRAGMSPGSGFPTPCLDFVPLRTVLNAAASMLGTFWSDILVTAALLITGAGCSGHSARVPEPADPRTSPTSELSSLTVAPLTAARQASVFIQEHSLAIPLPEPKLWQVNKVGTYARGTHTETASVLWLKRWRQGERVSFDSCAHQSRLWQPKLVPPAIAPTRELTLTAPDDYHTRIAFHEWRDGVIWHGQLTAHGAAIRDCISYIYLTKAPNSPLGKVIVAQRLNAMLDALENARVQSAPIDRQ